MYVNYEYYFSSYKKNKSNNTKTIGLKIYI